MNREDIEDLRKLLKVDLPACLGYHGAAKVATAGQIDEFCDLALKGLNLPEAVPADTARYRWLREHGDQGVYVLRDWKQGDPTPPLELAQGAELDQIIDEYLGGSRKPQNEKPAGDTDRIGGTGGKRG